MKHISKAIALCGGIALTPACTQESGGQPPSPPSTVVESAWGDGPGELGRVVGNEAASFGPMSFAVDSKSTVHVLDQVNARIQKFSHGAAIGQVPIPDRAFADIELDGQGGYALLDRYRNPAVVFVDANGTVSSEVSLLLQDIPSPARITALMRQPDGFYVQVAGEYLVRVADQARESVEPSLIPGQALVGNSAIKASLAQGKTLGLYRIGAPGTPPTKLPSIGLGGNAATITLLDEAPDSGIFLGVREFGASATHTLYVLDANGNEQARVSMPDAVSDPVEVTQSVRVGEDGRVYARRSSESAFEIEEVMP